MSRKLAFALTAVVVLLAVPVGVVASHQFDDVPDSNVFHSDINWLANNGITRGCNPAQGNTRFCPKDPVTREQMSAFMKRFHDRFIEGNSPVLGVEFAERSQSDPPSYGNGVVDGLAMSLTIPEFGVLMVHANAEVRNTIDADALGCGINTGGSSSTAQVDSWRTIDLTSDIAGTCSTMTSFFAAPGSQIVRLVVANAQPTTGIHAGSVTAVLYTLDDVVPLDGDLVFEEGPAPDLPDTPKGG